MRRSGAGTWGDETILADPIPAKVRDGYVSIGACVHVLLASSMGPVTSEPNPTFMYLAVLCPSLAGSNGMSDHDNGNCSRNVHLLISFVEARQWPMRAALADVRNLALPPHWPSRGDDR